MSDNVETLKLTILTRQDVELSFNGEKLVWNIFAFDKTSKNDRTMPGTGYDIFEQNNAYWATFSVEKQARIFAIYTEIFNLLDFIPLDMDWRLRSLVKSLYEEYDLDDLKKWVDYKAAILLPDNLDEVYVDSPEISGSRNRTYLKEDYKWLLVLSVALRAMIPIWGEYIAKTSKDKGTTYKEMFAARLLKGSKIEKSEPIEKLKIFITETIPAEKSKASAVLAGISEEDFPEWMTALTLVRRICIGDIRGLPDQAHLVKLIFQYIRYKVGAHENNFIGRVRDKDSEATSSDEVKNLSTIEEYKMRQEISAGYIGILKFGLRSHQKVLKRICPGIAAARVNESIQICTRNLANVSINQGQVAIVQYLLAPVIPPQGVMHLPKRTLIHYIGVIQAILWHHGHHEMAMLVGAEGISNSDYLSIGHTTSRTRILKEQLTELETLFPFNRRPSGKQKTVKIQNTGVIAIDELFDIFTANDWKLNIPESWLVEAGITNVRINRFPTSNDIKVKIATLVIEIAKHETPFNLPNVASK